MAEWIFTAKWAGYKWTEFIELPVEDREFIIATRRIEGQIEAVVTNEQKEKSEKEARKNKMKSRKRRR